ncbi:MAG: dihydrodipicolinate synthase family protein [Haloferacaceae archaeon]
MTEFHRKPMEGILALSPLCLNDDGSIDYDGIRSNVEWLEEQGVHGFIQFATMGQSMAPSEDEFDAVADVCVDAADDITCVIGSSASNQQEAIRRATYAEEAGADGTLLELPYMIPLQEEWVGDFYRDVAAELEELAIIAYNYPPATGVDISVDTWREELLDVELVKAVKDSNYATTHYDRILNLSDEINVISPYDCHFWHDSQLGGEGLIGILTWAAPQTMLRYYRECAAGNHHDEWVLELSRTLAEVWGGVSSLPGRPIVSNSPAILHELAEMSDRPAGPVRPPYRRLDDRAAEALQEAVEPLREIEREL